MANPMQIVPQAKNLGTKEKSITLKLQEALNKEFTFEEINKVLTVLAHFYEDTYNDATLDFAQDIVDYVESIARKVEDGD